MVLAIMPAGIMAAAIDHHQVVDEQQGVATVAPGDLLGNRAGIARNCALL